MAEFEKRINLGDIKSSYVRKELLSFLNPKRILNIIIYNKHLQKLYGLDINDYKEISGKYKIAEKNGKGKEYDLYTNNMVFEGEYLNGKRIGKGKEYHDKICLIFAGEFSNGLRKGKGKEYYYCGKLKFEGEYLNGKIWTEKDIINMVI